MLGGLQVTLTLKSGRVQIYWRGYASLLSAVFLVINVQSLKQVLVVRLGATTFIQNKRKKATLNRRERQTGSVDLYGVEPG